jgi:hypothetical protein
MLKKMLIQGVVAAAAIGAAAAVYAQARDDRSDNGYLAQPVPAVRSADRESAYEGRHGRDGHDARHHERRRRDDSAKVDRRGDRDHDDD